MSEPTAFKFQRPPRRRTSDMDKPANLSAKPRANLVSRAALASPALHIVKADEKGFVEVTCPCCGSTNKHGPGKGMRGPGSESMPNAAYGRKICDGFAWGAELFDCPGYVLVPADMERGIEVMPVMKEGWWPRTKKTPSIEDSKTWKMCQVIEAEEHWMTTDMTKTGTEYYGYGKHAVRALETTLPKQHLKQQVSRHRGQEGRRRRRRKGRWWRRRQRRRWWWWRGGGGGRGGGQGNAGGWPTTGSPSGGGSTTRPRNDVASNETTVCV